VQYDLFRCGPKFVFNSETASDAQKLKILLRTHDSNKTSVKHHRLQP